MYNAHPFPNSYGVPPSRSDDRLCHIYERFLNIPLHTIANATFLDAGCGTGENSLAWRRILDPSVRIIAVDLSRASVAIARARGGDQREMHFVVGSLTDIGLAEASVDMILCSGVLHHIPRRGQAFEELVRVLKPGGFLVLILYHRYGRAVHGLRRAVIDLIERDDVDRRARLGGKLFGHSMRKLAAKEQVPVEGVLYDQFGPCESRHSVGEVLSWFARVGIDYLGTWPPVEWRQFGNALRFSYRFRRAKPGLFPLLIRLFPAVGEAPSREPGLLTRASMQLLWALDQQQLFAIAGRKQSGPEAPGYPT